MDYLHLVAVFISNEWLWVAHGFSFNHITQLESFVFCNKFKSFTLVVQPNWLQSGNTKLFLKRLFVECLKKMYYSWLESASLSASFWSNPKMWFVCQLAAPVEQQREERLTPATRRHRWETSSWYCSVPVNPPNMNRNRNRFPFSTYCSSYLNKYLLSVIFFHDQLLLISGDPSWGCEVWSVKDTVKTYYTSSCCLVFSGSSSSFVWTTEQCSSPSPALPSPRWRTLFDACCRTTPVLVTCQRRVILI